MRLTAEDCDLLIQLVIQVQIQGSNAAKAQEVLEKLFMIRRVAQD